MNQPQISETRNDKEAIVAGHKILIVDDDQDFASGLGDILELEGFQTRTAHSFNQALAEIQTFKAHVAILDYRLGPAVGLDLVEPLKAACPDITCLLSTAYSDQDVAIRSLRSGIYDFFRKPVRPEELLAAVRRSIEKHVLAAEKREAERSLVEHQQALKKQLAKLRQTQESLNDKEEELLRLAEGFVVVREQAQRANRAKGRLLTALELELREPLKAVFEFTDFVLREGLVPLGDPRFARVGEELRDAGSGILDLIGDLLDLTALESGTEGISKAELSVPKVVESVKELVLARAAAKAIELDFETAPGDLALVSDEKPLVRCLVNTLTSSIMHTQNGGRIALRAAGTPRGGCQFIIEDSGPGLSAQQLQIALALYSETKRADSLGQSGERTGITLSLAKSYLELLGGLFEMEVLPEGGNRAILELSSVVARGTRQ